jgi:SAM-dependent methyltransferase
MPTSEHWQIPWIVDLMIREQPQTVLDVGAGYGKYGVLVREFVNPTRLDAVDANPPRFPVYDHFYQGDIGGLSELLPADPPQYDLALFIETIEHLEKDQAWHVLTQLARRARRVLVSTPWGFRPQEVPGQPFETHRSGWYPWEFRRQFRLHAVRLFPGHLSRYLRIPKLWQFVVLVSARDQGTSR